jgi:translation initiation factor 2 beta subunit (eIF-2beta)/eIF-5
MSVNFNVDLTSVKNQKDLFEQLAQFDEVFGNKACGKCDGHDLAYVVREVNDNKFYELRCRDCGAKLAFGAHKTGNTLFPKRKDGENWLPDRGWVKYNKETGKEE